MAKGSPDRRYFPPGIWTKKETSMMEVFFTSDFFPGQKA